VLLGTAVGAGGHDFDDPDPAAFEWRASYGFAATGIIAFEIGAHG
jgi:hypothetical protein